MRKQMESEVLAVLQQQFGEHTLLPVIAVLAHI